MAQSVDGGPVRLGRFSTLRAWMSQWLVQHSRADAEASAKLIAGATHYYQNQPDHQWLVIQEIES